MPHHDGEEERVEGRGVGHDGEDGAPLAFVAELVELHLVEAHELAHLKGSMRVLQDTRIDFSVFPAASLNIL